MRIKLRLLRWSIKFRAKLQEPINWQDTRKLFLLSQLAGAAAFCHFARYVPAPGIAIAVLGAMAGVMAFRADAKEIEKVCWVGVIFGLMIIEIVALGREHKRQEESSNTIIRNGVRTLQAVTDNGKK